MRYNQEKLLDLCHILLPQDPTLETEVRFSMEYPMQYLLHTRRQGLSGTKERIPRPIGNLPWFALIHALKDRHLILNLNQHPSLSKPSYKQSNDKRWAWVIKEGRWNTSYATSVDGPDQEYKTLFFQLAKHYLQPFGYVLCEFSPSLFAYAVTVLPYETAQVCKQLAEDSGYGRIHIALADHMASFDHQPYFLLLLHLFQQEAAL